MSELLLIGLSDADMESISTQFAASVVETGDSHVIVCVFFSDAVNGCGYSCGTSAYLPSIVQALVSATAQWWAE